MTNDQISDRYEDMPHSVEGVDYVNPNSTMVGGFTNRAIRSLCYLVGGPKKAAAAVGGLAVAAVLGYNALFSPTQAGFEDMQELYSGPNYDISASEDWKTMSVTYRKKGGNGFFGTIVNPFMADETFHIKFHDLPDKFSDIKPEHTELVYHAKDDVWSFERETIKPDTVYGKAMQDALQPAWDDTVKRVDEKIVPEVIERVYRAHYNK